MEIVLGLLWIYGIWDGWKQITGASGLAADKCAAVAEPEASGQHCSKGMSGCCAWRFVCGVCCHRSAFQADEVCRAHVIPRGHYRRTVRCAAAWPDTCPTGAGRFVRRAGRRTGTDGSGYRRRLAKGLQCLLPGYTGAKQDSTHVGCRWHHLLRHISHAPGRAWI